MCLMIRRVLGVFQLAVFLLLFYFVCENRDNDSPKYLSAVLIGDKINYIEEIRFRLHINWCFIMLL